MPLSTSTQGSCSLSSPLLGFLVTCQKGNETEWGQWVRNTASGLPPPLLCVMVFTLGSVLTFCVSRVWFCFYSVFVPINSVDLGELFI